MSILVKQSYQFIEEGSLAEGSFSGGKLPSAILPRPEGARV
ncbi:hypothetical protein [aff. Roholtiella sp. LEGE 12411]|nr:hypothetical protein [aff. Roholtiella sp. LEGE 12411]